MKIAFDLPMCSPQDAVFAAISDPKLRPVWQRSLSNVIMEVDEPPALGNRWRERTKLGLGFAMETIVFDRPRAWSERGRGGLVEAELHVALSPEGEGTRLSLTLELKPPFLLALFMRPIPPFIERELRSDLVRLDALAQRDLSRRGAT